MDHHHQWRPRPSSGTICPVCSVSHFPFCTQHYHHHPPPPLPYYQGPRILPSQHDFYRPAFNPHHGSIGTCASNGYAMEYDRSHKRPRVDGINADYGSSTLTNENHDIQPRDFSEDERRLKLIHDHGITHGLPRNGGASLQREEAFDKQQYSLQDGLDNEEYIQSRYPRFDRPFSNIRHIRPPHSHNWQDDQSQHYDMQMANHHNFPGPSLGHHQYMHANSQFGVPNLTEPGNCLTPPPPQPSSQPPNGWMYNGQPPPLPASPPPPFPPVPSALPFSEFKSYHSSPSKSFPLFPVAYGSSTATAPSSYPPEEPQNVNKAPSKQLSPLKPTVMDASKLFHLQYRARRPNHFVIILRGLPGSGKSYLAKMLRNIEVENGGIAPRIHSMDDYFMTEVENVEESDASKYSSSIRGKKPTLKKAMEYFYEPEMEEAYRSSMLKAFKKTLEEGMFKLVIVDDRNLRVADFAQFWAIAKRLGYEVYISEATYKDPAGCAARNVHGFSLDEIQKMAGQWEEAPSLYMQLDIKSLFLGDDMKESGIQEVDMEHENVDSDSSELQEHQKVTSPSAGIDVPNENENGGRRWNTEGDQHDREVKDLRASKWSHDLGEDDAKGSETAKGTLKTVSVAHGKQRKSVRWSDQAAGNTGFSIGSASKQANVASLVIGPGNGYNLKSNPLAEEERLSQNTGKSKKPFIFEDQLRAERESFKSVFDKRRQQMG